MADLTITVPDGQVDRIRTAFADQAGVDPASFTAEDMRQALITYMKDVVRGQEATAALTQIDQDAEALRQAYTPAADPDIT